MGGGLGKSKLCFRAEATIASIAASATTYSRTVRGRGTLMFDCRARKEQEQLNKDFQLQHQRQQVLAQAINCLPHLGPGTTASRVKRLKRTCSPRAGFAGCGRSHPV